MITPLPLSVWKDMADLALREDLGRRGDITSRNLFNDSDIATGVFSTRKDGIVCGMDVAAYILEACAPGIKLTRHAKDGDTVKTGQSLLTASGSVIGLLEAERSALNFLSHLSGIATLTGRYVDAVAGTGAKICCTRKTTPGLRVLEKYAVLCGGGVNHRFGLDDAVMLKDNHIAASGDIGRAIDTVRSRIGHMVKIEVEVETPAQLEQALAHRADVIMLDNWPLADLPAAVAAIGGRAVTEASGGITLESVHAVAVSGINLISVGALTHSAPILDIGLDFT